MWYKRYVEHVYDMPSSPSAIVGRAGHIALEHFYGGLGKGASVELGLAHIRAFPDFEINFGTARTAQEKKRKRASMEREYVQAISFYLARPPRHIVLGIEIRGIAEVHGLALPLKAISDLVVQSRVSKKAVDIIDHKFVDSFSTERARKALFVIQALFNYYTVKKLYKRPVGRFIVYECKKRKNLDGSSQMRRYVIDFKNCAEEFSVFHRLINDATADISRHRKYLPNPSDMFDGEHSFDLYRLNLLD